MSESTGGTGSTGGSGEKHAQTARLLWGSAARTRPARGPRPTLDLARVARSGVELADAEGLSAVSMQRVAAQLGVTKMALYRYVPGKAELVALMCDEAVGPYPGEDPPGGGWRDRLTRWAEQMLAVHLRHPWVLDVTVGPRVIGPEELSWVEAGIAALDGTSLTAAERLDSAVLLANHVRGIAAQTRATNPDESQETALSAAMSELLRERREQYPALAKAIATTHAEPAGRDQAWEFGVQRILDGLAVLMDRRPAAGRSGA